MKDKGAWDSFLSGYPSPIAEVIRVEVQGRALPKDRAEGLLHLVEITLQYAALVAVADYIRTDLKDERVSYRLERLRRPHVSDFVQFLQVSTQVLGQRGLLFVPPLGPSVRQAQTELVTVLRMGERGMEPKKMPLLDAVVNLRNMLAHRRWQGHWQTFIEHHTPAVARLLELMDWMSRYPLLGQVEDGRWVRLMGPGPNFQEAGLPEALKTQGARLLLADPSYQRFLPLEPWMIWEDCLFCEQESRDVAQELFLFNGEEGPRYVAYAGARHARILETTREQVRQAYARKRVPPEAIRVTDLTYPVLYERAFRHSQVWLTLQQAGRRYIPAIYHPRPDIEAQLERFLQSPEVAFLLVGEAGIGKTALISRQVETWCERGEIVLAYDGDQLSLTESIEDRCMRDLHLVGEFVELIAWLHREGRRIIIVVDGIDQHPDGSELLRRLRGFVLRYQKDPLKAILACRTLALENALRATAGDVKHFPWISVEPQWFPPNTFYARTVDWAGQPPKTCRWVLGPLPKSAVESLYENYRAYREEADGSGRPIQFRPKTAFRDLSPSVQQLLAHPGYLRWAVETFDGRPIPDRLDGPTLLKAWVATRLSPKGASGLWDESLDPSNMVRDWIRWFREKKATAIDRETIHEAMPQWTSALAMFPQGRSPYGTLIDRGMWVEVPSVTSPAHPDLLSYRVRPASALVLEYLVAEQIRQEIGEQGLPTAEQVRAWSQEARDWPPLVGAMAILAATSIQRGDFSLCQDILQSAESPVAEDVLTQVIRTLDSWGDEGTVSRFLESLRTFPDQERIRGLWLRIAYDAWIQPDDRRVALLRSMMTQRSEVSAPDLTSASGPPRDLSLTDFIDLGKLSSRADMEYEVYYCGLCRRQQRPQEGERCKVCGTLTVSWFTDREDADEVHRRWESLFGPASVLRAEREALQASASAPHGASSPAVVGGFGGGSMAQVFVDPERLEEFAARLVAFSRDVEEIRRVLQGSLQNLSATWRDQEFEQFQQAFVRVEKILLELMQEIQAVHPKLKADAQYIREYLQIKP